jgi:hypothetical protein
LKVRLPARLPALSPAQRRAIRDGVALAGLAYFAWLFLVNIWVERNLGADATAYWLLDPAHPYEVPAGVFGAFVYPPPMVRVFAPAAMLSWPQFWLLWMAVLVATVIWLGGRRTLLVLAFPAVALELYYANINLLLAAAIALGFRYPAAWAFVLLTKVTPGVGLLWFVVRREWRHLGIALGATVALASTSLLLDMPLWSQWIDALERDAGMPLGMPIAPPLWLRLPLAAAVVIWGARTNRPWTVPVAVTISLPILWLAALSVLAALVAINRPELRPAPRPATSSGS